VKIYEIREEQKELIIVMEKCKDGDLDSLMKNRKFNE
jgi:hypothetical protein